MGDEDFITCLSDRSLLELFLELVLRTQARLALFKSSSRNAALPTSTIAFHDAASSIRSHVHNLRSAFQSSRVVRLLLLSAYSPL